MSWIEENEVLAENGWVGGRRGREEEEEED